MPAQPSSRKKREDKLDWEELEHAPNVDGMYSFLKPPPSETLPSVSLTPEVRRLPNKLRIHICTRLHDAHTPGEQVLLNTLYELARDPAYGQPVADGSWLVAASMAALSERIGMHETNIRMNLRSLTAKLAIEVTALEDRKKQSARQYHLYTPDQILDRRNRAGLRWVVKNRGIHFVNPETGQPVLR
jgi:hypothetical protein